MTTLNHLKIPVEANIKTTYQPNNVTLFDEGNNLIIEVLPNSYRIVNTGFDYEVFEGITSSAVLVKESLYKFSVVTRNTSEDLGLILASLQKSLSATPGIITAIEVRDHLNYSDSFAGQGFETRNCMFKFQAVTGTVNLVRGQKARPGGYQIEFTQII
ncbi:hypothetical protein [Crocosphaera watsonii]|uniref:Uncharacterized protein n=1 Tax=Crocosphaera watsonii WH 0401 TaxID=555881 RepID=T2J755_CROWT|nr:hypothetical protein [Crocosphaera watsonii]CCQ61713.1 hypothetical protein CWATWH0401_3268 [Crocosphaera watsonii WH 0401]